MVLLRRITSGAGEQFVSLSKQYDLAAREAAALFVALSFRN